MTRLLTAVQVLGIVAVLTGVAIWLPLWGSLVLNGLLVALLATTAECIAQGRPGPPQDRRSGPTGQRVG